MRTENLLIEIGTEELPPKALKHLGQSFADNFQAALDDAELSYSGIHWYAAPRRLAVSVSALAESLPAYEQVMKASHAFNLLDARHAISVTERQRYILRVRTLAKACAESYFQAREALGFPLCNKEQ